jgi:hypothetical protein
MSSTAVSPPKPAVDVQSVTAYLDQVEPIRLAVNDLLESADPILAAYRAERLTPVVAGELLEGLERQFAAYSAAIRAIQPTNLTLRRMHAPYARTYELEDAYLRALVAALPDRSYGRLPHSQGQQREAIIRWRTNLNRLMQGAGVAPPTDLQIAGRGEIAPSPTGS